MITSYNYEGKIKEEVLKNCLNELNVSEETEKIINNQEEKMKILVLNCGGSSLI